MSSNSAFLDSSSNSPATRRRRAQIACRNCRKRKIKCVTNEEPPHNPCERCRRKGLTCEYVAVGEPSPPSTPASEHPPIALNNQPYPYGGGSSFPHYGVPYTNSNQMPVGYSDYTVNNPAQLQSRFQSESQSSWNVAGLNSVILNSQPGSIPGRPPYYPPPEMFPPSNQNPSHWHETPNARIPNPYEQYYPNMPASSGQPNIPPYGSQSYESTNLCHWCRSSPCVCGSRR
ncbi:hypothetical protein GYMLUDRAFT_82608 [Collybiopsis luxurians FD-317 M1]|nr:hypothetical protein GYMLUDRAFT_82608 [Collybiopsis luxurians FD-317 M1]